MCYTATGFGICSNFLSTDELRTDFDKMLPNEDIRMPGDPGYAVCICGGQGDCLGCLEQESQFREIML